MFSAHGPSKTLVRFWQLTFLSDKTKIANTRYCQRKFRNLTSDYTESCCWRSWSQEMWSRRCDTAEMWDMRIWRVGSARNAVFFHSFVGWLGKSAPKNGRVRRICCPRCGKICPAPARKRFGSQHRSKLTASEHFWKFKSPKSAPRRRRITIWKSTSSKTGSVGAHLEVEVAKICATPARESDLELKIVKNWQSRSTFGSWSRQNLHHACAWRRFGSQNR